MPFIKYPEIENSYRKKYIDKFKETNPEIIDCEYIAQEKIHGSNIQIIIPGYVNKYDIASRKRVLSSQKDKLYDIWNDIKQYRLIIEKLVNYAYKENIHINTYGEYYGPSIQSGIDYGKDKRILFFDIRISGFLLSPKTMFTFLSSLNLEPYIVPTVGYFKCLDEALKIDIENTPTFLNKKEGNILEGVVIKPYNKVITSPIGDTFMLKHKALKFLENSSKKKDKGFKKETKISEIIEALHQSFLEYINENRIQSIFSKEGEIKELNQIGKYIKLVLEDAKNDFNKDYGNIVFFSKSERKYIFNAGSKIKTLLDKYL